MIGTLLTRGLVMIFGYAYPAYECFKTVEKNKPEIEQLRFWCQYWILVALMTVFERVGDTFVSWVPMYSEAKLAFIIFLWYPKTKGTTYVYQSFFRPYIAKHETNIDRNLMELRTRAGDVTFMYFQKVAIFGQTRIFEILQFVAAKSSPRPHATQPQQPQQPAPRSDQSPAPPKHSAKKTQAPQPQPSEETPSPTSSSSSTLPEKDEEVKNLTSSKGSPSILASPVPSHASTTPLKKSISIPGCQVQGSSPLKKSVSLPSPPTPASSCQSTTNNEEKESTPKIEPIPPASPKVVRSIVRTPRAPRNTVMEENIRVTRGRLRKAWSTTTK